eukprot:3449380-Pleurochrysis_carterae.AAC.1
MLLGDGVRAVLIARPLNALLFALACCCVIRIDQQTEIDLEAAPVAELANRAPCKAAMPQMESRCAPTGPASEARRLETRWRS